MSSREFYIIAGNTPEDLHRELNFILQRISDRLDKLEGIRGKTEFDAAGVDVVGDVIVKDSDEETIHSME